MLCVVAIQVESALLAFLTLQSVSLEARNIVHLQVRRMYLHTQEIPFPDAGPCGTARIRAHYTPQLVSYRCRYFCKA